MSRRLVVTALIVVVVGNGCVRTGVRHSKGADAGSDPGDGGSSELLSDTSRADRTDTAGGGDVTPTDLFREAMPPDQTTADGPAEDSSPVVPSIILSDGFETSLAPWKTYTKTGDTVTLTSAVVHSGNYAAQCSTDTVKDASAMVYVDFGDTPTIYVRMHVYLGAGFATQSDYVNLARIEAPSTVGSIFNAGLTAAGVPIMKNYVNGITSFGSAPAFQPGVWHQVELHAKVGGVSGMLRMWVDKALVIDKASVDIGTTDVTRVGVGITWQGNNTEPFTVYVDDVSIATAPVP